MFKDTSVLWRGKVAARKKLKKRRIDLLTFDWIDSLFFSQEAWQIDFKIHSSSILALQSIEALIHLRIFINVMWNSFAKKDVLLWLNSNVAPPWSEMKREQWCINQDQSRELEKLHFTCVSVCVSFVLAFPYWELGTYPGLIFSISFALEINFKDQPQLKMSKNDK